MILGASLLVLAACAPPIPDSGEGVGFNDYADFEVDRARREAALQGQATPTLSPNGAIVTPDTTIANEGVSSSELAAAGINVDTPPDQQAPVATAPLETPPATTQTALAANPDISDEQSFQAVAGRETIESDAERRERQAAAYLLIEVTDLPDRSGNVGPNIVQYALQAPNDRGQPVFSRTNLFGEGRFQRNCAKYRTPDDAQRDFISRGGPQRDRLGIDPDGDGFACGWDPQAFRTLASGN